AEDGIRDFHVTGVQTCALPISSIKPSLMRLRTSGYEMVRRLSQYTGDCNPEAHVKGFSGRKVTAPIVRRSSARRRATEVSIIWKDWRMRSSPDASDR